MTPILAHVVRIGPARIRKALLLVFFPIEWAAITLHHLAPVRWGGHPHKRAMLTPAYFAMPYRLFIAAWRGHFVPCTARGNR